jgi:hypothetical protein
LKHLPHLEGAPKQDYPTSLLTPPQQLLFKGLPRVHWGLPGWGRRGFFSLLSLFVGLPEGAPALEQLARVTAVVLYGALVHQGVSVAALWRAPLRVVLRAATLVKVGTFLLSVINGRRLRLLLGHVAFPGLLF